MVTKLRAVAVAVLSLDWFGWVPRSLLARLLVWAGVCDLGWYASIVMGEPGAKPADALAHLLSNGLSQGHSGCPVLDCHWYGERFKLRGSPLQILAHYAVFGDRIGLAPGPWFDPRHCRATEPRVSLRYWLMPVLGRYLRNYHNSGQPHPLFDQAWYLERNPDVSRSGINPLLHFLYYGIAEGRQPNPFFSPSWYLEAYPDVANAALDPVSHYIRYGAAENRSPGPEFDARQYLDMYPDVADSRMGALAHYLSIGRRDGRSLGKRPLSAADLQPSFQASPVMGVGVVDIVLPVYRGLKETADCLESVLRSRNRVAVRLHVYNDCSPESEVTEYLRTMADRHPEIRLAENPVNLGFVRTVNAGMTHAMTLPDSIAVLLLNSDTIVSADWVDRLAAHLAGDRIGTVTALSNNATICSYPKFGQNRLPEGLRSGYVDQVAARVNAGVSVEIPTGVGFCMLISRACLERVGFFDAEAFGKGYGEENDFCMRAGAVGFRNLLAMDVFVEHVGEVSFADDSKPGKILAQKIIDERYPDYTSRVSRFCAMDPGFSGRVRLTLSLWRLKKREVTLIVTHTWGGGTERAVQEAIKRLGDTGEVAIIRPLESQQDSGVVQVVHPAAADGFEFEYRYRDTAELHALFEALGVTAIQIHHLVGFGPSLRSALARYATPYSFHVHDYYVICPQITMTTASGLYCGEPGANACDSCIAARPSNGAHDIRNWRTSNAWVVQGASTVIAPSEDTACRFERYFQRDVEVRYHEEQGGLCAPRLRRGRGELPYRIVLLGALAPHKGSSMVLDLARIIRAHALPLRLELIGYPQGQEDELKAAGLRWSGSYAEQDLDRIINEVQPDAFLFLSQAPETYSYTLSHALLTGFPVAANRLGAFTERLIGHPCSMLLDPTIDAQTLGTQICNWLDAVYGKGTEE